VATDYDCWLDDPSQHVSVEQVIAQFKDSLGKVQKVIAKTVMQYEEDESRPCRQALKAAVVTPREQLTAEQKQLLDFLSI
jgi:5'-methylthioadenosine phosphorylase